MLGDGFQSRDCPTLDGTPPVGEAGPWCGRAAPVEPDEQRDAEGQGPEKGERDKPRPFDRAERLSGKEIAAKTGSHMVLPSFARPGSDYNARGAHNAARVCRDDDCPGRVSRDQSRAADGGDSVVGGRPRERSVGNDGAVGAMGARQELDSLPNRERISGRRDDDGLHKSSTGRDECPLRLALRQLLSCQPAPLRLPEPGDRRGG